VITAILFIIGVLIWGLHRSHYVTAPKSRESDKSKGETTMPGEISKSNPGPAGDTPLVPSWVQNQNYEMALDLIEADPHCWSKRPCPTCRSVTIHIGRNFGCMKKAVQQSKSREDAG
jgi:hypothetical protein